MARSFASVKFVANMLPKQVFSVTTPTRRMGFAAVSQGVEASRKVVEKEPASAPWIPDPKTGYYRPENAADEIDVAELRELVLKAKNIKN